MLWPFKRRKPDTGAPTGDSSTWQKINAAIGTGRLVVEITRLWRQVNDEGPGT